MARAPRRPTCPRDLRHLLPAALLVLPACGPKTSGTGGGGTHGSTGAGSTGVATAATGTATGGTTTRGPGTTGPPPAECGGDGDCMVVDDCCSCVVIPQDEPAPPCPAVDCAATACDGLGFFDPQAVCFGGVCRFREVGCDPTFILCEAPPPDCPEGWLPRVEDNCWQGCVPVEACDTVPGCDWCTEGEICVTFTDLAGLHVDCEPVPVGCDPADPCACTPAFCAEGMECSAVPGGGVECTCGLC